MLLVMTTMPDVQSARALAGALVEGRLAACVSIQSGCESFYRWNGAVEQAHEVPVLIKTTAVCAAGDRGPSSDACAASLSAVGRFGDDRRR